MNSFERELSRFVNDRELLLPQQQVLVGVSGGVDSVVLLVALQKLGYYPSALHCNFHLRGEESNRDQTFVEFLCQKLCIPLKVRNFETVNYSQGRGISIEMAARELRYEWFEAECQSQGIASIAVAHHRDDSIESFFLNLVRGTGIKGLCGIPVVNGRVIRPLSLFSRQQIVRYAHENGLSFVEDSTNQESIYLRNSLRNEIIPSFTKINTAALPHIYECMERLNVVQEVYQEWIDCQKNRLVTQYNDGYTIQMGKLTELKHWPTILFEILSPHGFNSVTIDSIARAIEREGASGKRFFSSTHELLIDREKIYVYPQQDPLNRECLIADSDTLIQAEGLIVSLERVSQFGQFEIQKDLSILYADYSRLRFPLKLRHWRQGDSFIPFGMKGRKKVSDFFSDQKISVYEKGRIWLLVDSHEEVLWIVGYRPSEKIRVQTTTKEIYRIKIQNEESTQSRQ